MATKAKMMKLLQEIRGFAEITYRRPPTRPPGLFLIQMRSHAAQSAPPKRKLIIPIRLDNDPDFAHPVKITVKSNA